MEKVIIAYCGKYLEKPESRVHLLTAINLDQVLLSLHSTVESMF